MTTPTFEIVRTRLKHTGGTKFYEIMAVASSEGGAILSLRYGKIGSFGQMQVEYYSTRGDATSAFVKKQVEKEKRGYELVAASDQFSKSNISIEELPIVLGPSYYKMGADNIHKLHPNLSIKGVTDPTCVEFSKNGDRIEKPPRMIEEDNSALELAEKNRLKKIQDAEEAAKMAVQEKYNKNPLYGAFS